MPKSLKFGGKSWRLGAGGYVVSDLMVKRLDGAVDCLKIEIRLRIGLAGRFLGGRVSV
jgi:hypothetical protein